MHCLGLLMQLIVLGFRYVCIHPRLCNLYLRSPIMRNNNSSGNPTKLSRVIHSCSGMSLVEHDVKRQSLNIEPKLLIYMVNMFRELG